MTKPVGVLRAALMIAVGCAIGCDADEDSTSTAPALDADAGDFIDPQICPALVSDQDCDRDRPPIVFVHGNASAGDGFSHPAQLFASNGYCALRIRSIDYDAITRGNDAASYAAVAAQLDQVIAELQDRTGAKQVTCLVTLKALPTRHVMSQPMPDRSHITSTLQVGCCCRIRVA